MDDDNFAERSVALIVVHSNLHFKRGERREGLVPVLVHRGVRRGHHLLLPASRPVGTKGNDIAKALAVLELLRHRLKIKRSEIKAGLTALKSLEMHHLHIISCGQLLHGKKENLNERKKDFFFCGNPE